MRLCLVLTLLLAADPVEGLPPVLAQSAAPAAREAVPAAPPPGSPAIYKAAPELAVLLKAAMARTEDTAIAAVSNTDQYRVNIVNRRKPGNALAHPGNSELHYVIEGRATLVTGGHIVRPAGGNAMATIDGGETRQVGPGDVVIVPVGSAHWYKEIEGSFTYLEVRFVAPK